MLISCLALRSPKKGSEISKFGWGTFRYYYSHLIISNAVLILGGSVLSCVVVCALRGILSLACGFGCRAQHSIVRGRALVVV